MNLDILALLGRVAASSSFEDAAREAVAFGRALPGVEAVGVAGARSIEDLELRWLASDGLEASLALTLALEGALEAWRGGAASAVGPARALALNPQGEAPACALPVLARLSAAAPAALVFRAAEPLADEAARALIAARDLLALARAAPAVDEAPPAPVKRGAGLRREGILTRSPKMERIFRKLDRVVGLAVPVLIMGPTGTGKELIARAIHRSGPRKARRFFAQNCAAITEGLLESELFGYVKGAFTGADRDRKGLFEVASGSTLFLDEIGEMPLEMQKKLLRVLQEREVTPLGSTAPRPVDVRIVCATNRDLAAEVASGRFREDLFYRLQVIQVSLPPLDERPEDIPLLIDHFLSAVQAERGGPRCVLDRQDPRVLAAFQERSWPGNIRELENTVVRLAHFADGRITYAQLMADKQFRTGLRAPRLDDGPVRPLERVVEEAERAEIEKALRRADGNRSRAADLLRVNRRSFLRRLKKYGL